jgi:hypothetical protein
MNVTDEGLQIGRRVKAKRIAEAIRSLGGTVAEAKLLSDDEWLGADQLSRKRTGMGNPKRGQPDKPPSLETRALVIEYLAQEESAQAFEEPVNDCPARDEDVR